MLHRPPPPSLSLRPILSTIPRQLLSRIPPPPLSSHIRPKNRVFASLSHCHTARRPLQASCHTPLDPHIPVKLADSQQARDLSSHHHHHHGHGHHHHDPNPFLTSKDKTDPGVRITRVGLYVNLVMVITKGLGGWFFNSQALVADAFHALTDMVSDIMTLATVSFALSPPTERFPNGYGKIESLGSLGVSSLLLVGGVAMGYGSLMHIVGDFAPALAMYLPHVHVHDHTHAIPSLNAAWLALASIVTKEWLYRKTMKIARQKKSSVLASNAVHHRVDSLTAIVALVAIAGSNVFPGASWLDPVGGLLVAAMVVQAGAGNTRAALEELTDAGIDHEVKDEVTKKVVEVGEEVVLVDGIKSGQNYLLTITVAANEDHTLRDLEEVEKKVRSSVSNIGGMWKVHVRFVRKDGLVPNEFVKLNKKED